MGLLILILAIVGTSLVIFHLRRLELHWPNSTLGFLWLALQNPLNNLVWWEGESLGEET